MDIATDMEDDDSNTSELRGSVLSTDPIIEIRFVYDTIKGDYIKDDTSYYEYSEITKTEYQVSLFPIGEDLESLHLRAMTSQTQESIREQ